MNSKIFAALGLSDFKSYLMKYLLPIFMMDFLVLFIFLFAFDNLYVQLLGVFIFVSVLGVLIGYPLIVIDNQAREIDETIHYFITYAGALSTVNLERRDLFVDLSEKSKYKEIAGIFKKLIYLVESIKVDFSSAAYKLSSIIKTEHFARFLERMGIALSFNTNASKFFLDEQKVLMDSYSIIYREGLERIRMVQEMFTSLILAFAFVLATILLVPFISGTDSSQYLQFGLVGIILLDLIMIGFAKFFIPKDNLYHNMGFDEGRQRVIVLLFLSITLCLIVTPLVFFLDIPIMIKIAASATPLIIVGWYSSNEEKKVWKRDILFPPFVRSLGDVHQAKGGTLTTTVETLLPHNFGILNDMVERVFKRLKITSDKFNSWYYFSKESGSALISEFMDIFVSVVYRGGSAQVAGEIVSENMTRINGLRDQKKEFASTLKGAVYGSFFGLALTLYVSLLISVLLVNIFTSLTGEIDASTLELVGEVFPSPEEGSDPTALASIYIGAILAAHALFSAFMIKQVDGGNSLSMFFDVVLLLWFGVVIEVATTFLFQGMFSSYFV